MMMMGVEWRVQGLEARAGGGVGGREGGGTKEEARGIVPVATC